MYLKKIEIFNFRKFYYGSNTKNDILDNNLKEHVTYSFALAKSDTNISKRTTLIVGQNNSGKTTLAYFLEYVSERTVCSFSDINKKHLTEVCQYIINKGKNDENIELNYLPFIGGIITIGVDDEREAYFNNLKSFINLKGAKNADIIVKVLWEPKDSSTLLQKISGINFNKNDNDLLNELTEVFKDIKLHINFYNLNNSIVLLNANERFLDVKFIKANNVKDDNILSNSFNKIIKHYLPSSKGNITKSVEGINESIDRDVLKNSNDIINKKLSKGNLNDKVKVSLHSSVTVENILKHIVRYSYEEDGHLIPENMYGLGYTRIILILSEVLDYVNNYKESEGDGKVNIIFIEEPETFMHPQLQKMFMNNLSTLVDEFIKIDDDNSKNLNSQLIVSTHSDHILNSKIENSVSFNNINYLFVEDNIVKVKELSDDKIVDNGGNIQFIIKYMKNNMEYLFFSDALIFVEGVTEYFYIKELIANDADLNGKFISVYLVGGAYAHKYIKLIKFLNIPTAIITDIDIKNKKDSDETNINSKDFKKYKTTNFTFCKITSLKNHTEKDTKKDTKKDSLSLNCIFEYIDKQPLDSNYKLFTQTKTLYKEYLPTSFEEALIIDNWNNEDFLKVLEVTMPIIYEKYKDDVLKNSRALQLRLKDNSRKTKLSKYLLEAMIIESKKIQTPKYIEEAKSFIKDKLNKRSNVI